MRLFFKSVSFFSIVRLSPIDFDFDLEIYELDECEFLEL